MSATETVLKASYDFDTETCGLYLGMHRICLVHPHVRKRILSESTARMMGMVDLPRPMVAGIEIITIQPGPDHAEDFVQIVVTTHKKD